jgi:hypothetical protein
MTLLLRWAAAAYTPPGNKADVPMSTSGTGTSKPAPCGNRTNVKLARTPPSSGPSCLKPRPPTALPPARKAALAVVAALAASGDTVASSLAARADGEGDEEEAAGDDAEPCVVLWPPGLPIADEAMLLLSATMRAPPASKGFLILDMSRDSCFLPLPGLSGVTTAVTATCGVLDDDAVLAEGGDPAGCCCLLSCWVVSAGVPGLAVVAGAATVVAVTAELLASLQPPPGLG